MRAVTPPVMLFAAGFGTRMRPLTGTRPKPLIEVSGRTLLDHTLDLTTAINPPRTVVNAHYLADQVIAHCHAENITISLEQSRILDTGGGLKAALPTLDTDVVITTNTDAIWHGPNPFQHLLSVWQPDHMDALLLCLPVENAIGRDAPGDFALDVDNRLTRIGDAVFSGVQIIKTAAVAAHPEDVFSLNVIWDAMIAEGRAHGALYPGTWCDVGTPSGIALAEAVLEGRDV